MVVRRIVVSGAEVAGEGEVKIAQHIIAHHKSHGGRDSYLIVGSDADLVLLGTRALSLSHACRRTLTCCVCVCGGRQGWRYRW